MPEILRIAGIIAVVAAAAISVSAWLANDIPAASFWVILSFTIPAIVGGALIWTAGEVVVLLRRIAASLDRQSRDMDHT